MRVTANNRVLDYLKYKDWTSSVVIERMGQVWGFKDSNLSRRLRELYNKGLLDRRIEGKIVYYRHKQARVIVFTSEQEMVIQEQQKNGVLF